MAMIYNDTALRSADVKAGASIRALDHATHTVVLATATASALGAFQLSIGTSQPFCLEVDGDIVQHQIYQGLFNPNPYYIAASDATLTEKSYASSICDGTADESEINVAWTVNKTVILSSGTFYIAGKITPVINGSLIGQGTYATTIKRASGFTDYIISGTPNGPVNIKNLNIDGDKYTYTGNYGGIFLSNADYAIIEDVYVHHTRIDGMRLENGCDHAKIIRPRIAEAGTTTITDDGTGTGTFQVGETIKMGSTSPVPNNYFTAVVGEVTNNHESLVVHQMNRIIPEPAISGNWYVEGVTSGATLRIDSVTHNGGHGIAWFDSLDVSVVDPYVYDCRQGIYISGHDWKLFRPIVDICNKGNGIDTGVRGTADRGYLEWGRVTYTRWGVILYTSHSHIVSPDILNSGYGGGLGIAGINNTVKLGRSTNYYGIDGGFALMMYIDEDGNVYGSYDNTVEGGLQVGVASDPAYPATARSAAGVEEENFVLLSGTIIAGPFTAGEHLTIAANPTFSAGFKAQTPTVTPTGIVIGRWVNEAAATKTRHLRGVPVIGQTVVGATSGASLVITAITHLIDRNRFVNTNSTGHNTMLGPNWHICGPNSTLDIVLPHDGIPDGGGGKEGGDYSRGSRQQGQATILSGATTVVVNHALMYPPTRINVEGIGNTDVKEHWLSAIDWENFTINVPAGVGANRLMMWSAER